MRGEREGEEEGESLMTEWKQTRGERRGVEEEEEKEEEEEEGV